MGKTKLKKIRPLEEFLEEKAEPYEEDTLNAVRYIFDQYRRCNLPAANALEKLALLLI